MSDAKRLFFALWPDDEVRQSLAKIARKRLHGKGRLVTPANLHLTLFFLGSVTPKTQEKLEVAAGSLHVAPITLILDQVGVWPKPRVAWSGASKTPAALVTLVDNLRENMWQSVFKPDTRAFKPHVTLVRKMREPLSTEPHRPVSWEANDFCLVESITHPQGVEYVPIRRWRLDGSEVTASSAGGGRNRR